MNRPDFQRPTLQIIHIATAGWRIAVSYPQQNQTADLAEMMTYEVVSPSLAHALDVTITKLIDRSNRAQDTMQQPLTIEQIVETLIVEQPVPVLSEVLRSSVSKSLCLLLRGSLSRWLEIPIETIRASQPVQNQHVLPRYDDDDDDEREHDDRRHL